MSADKPRSRFSRFMDRLTGGAEDAPVAEESVSASEPAVPAVAEPEANVAPVVVPDPVVVPAAEAEPVAASLVEETPTPAVPSEDAVSGRMSRLRQRLTGGFGRSVLGILGGTSVSELDWEDAEATLLQADLGLDATRSVLDGLKRATRHHGNVREALKALLLDELDVDAGRSLALDGNPAVIMVVGVNGTGKTTTCGKLGALLRAQGHSVVLGAADTFRAAATQQLQTWGSRIGVDVVAGPEGGDPASVAYDTVQRAVQQHLDVAIIDTAGRLHTKAGLMDELGKVKRVASKVHDIAEVLLVLDATTGQNGLTQAKVFSEAVQVTGVILTKLDGTAKGGIVFAVQRQLGVPVKYVGLGEGVDDLAPFDPEVFVESLLG